MFVARAIRQTQRTPANFCPNTRLPACRTSKLVRQHTFKPSSGEILGTPEERCQPFAKTFPHLQNAMRGFARTLKKKSTEIFQKAGMFFATELDGVSSHTFTTNPPRFTTHFTAFCTPKIARLPAKTPFHYARKICRNSVVVLQSLSICDRLPAKLLRFANGAALELLRRPRIVWVQPREHLNFSA